MRLKVTPLAIGIALSSIAGASYAQDRSSPLEEIIVTSSRVPLPLRQIGTSVSVITAEEIEAHGNLALTDILRQMPAIATSNNGGAGQATALRIRGEESFRTLVILDGIRIQDPSGTQMSAQLEHILSSGIGRVEILRGPQGLSYGADAGGIVNISSRQTEQGFNANFDAQLGSFSTQQLSGNIGAANEQFDFFLSIADSETDGYNSRPSDAVLQDDDGYENNTIHTRFGFNATENLRFGLVHRNVEGESEFDGCFSGSIVHDCVADYELSASRFSIEYEAENFSHSLAYAKTQTDRENFALAASSFVAEGEINRLEYIGSLTNLPGFNLVFGADIEEAISNDVSRDNTGLYLEYLSDFSDKLYLTAAVRNDDNDDFGSNTSYRASAAYLVDMGNDTTLKFKASLGTGFRAPSPFEISYNTGSFSYPPASLVFLKQEESEGYEFGVEYVAGNDLHLEAVYFDQEVENAIFFDLASFSGYLQDGGTSASEGLEVNAEYQLNDAWYLLANYTYNDTEQPDGLQRRRRPEDLANLGVSYSGLDEKLNINAYYRISRNSIDEVFGTIVDLDDFEVFDFSASYNINETFQIYGRIENVFDEEYIEVNDYNTAERAAYIGFRVNYSSI